jgi:AcrR family transcriptional regulator
VNPRELPTIDEGKPSRDIASARARTIASETVTADQQAPASSRASELAVSERVRQKERTRAALIATVRRLILDGSAITMLGVATAAGVSEATAYRHFPDLPALLREAFVGLWPEPPPELTAAGDYRDVPDRVAQATDFLLRNVVKMQGAVRVMIASTITRDEVTFPRPGKQFGLIDLAVGPLEQGPRTLAPRRLAQLKLDLAVIMSAEALFTLIDLAGLDPQDAIASVVHTARTITQAAMQAVT